MGHRAEFGSVLASARCSSAFGYGALAILSVSYFENRGDFFDSLGSLVLVPYLAFVCGSGLIAYFLGSWYVRSSETGIFEVLAVPAMVILCSAATAGVLFGIAAFASGDTSPYSTFAETLAGGLAAAMMFVLGTWLVLLLGAFVVTAWLAWRYGRRPAQHAF